MASMMKLIAIGNLGADPDTRYTADGSAVTNWRMAVSRTWKNASGEKQEETEWLRCVAFSKLAEVAGEYLQKGSPCAIVGRLKTREWEDKEGTKRFTTEVIVEELQLLGSKRDRDDGNEGDRPARSAKPASKPASKPAKSVAQGGTGFDDMDDDIPFTVQDTYRSGMLHFRTALERSKERVHEESLFGMRKAKDC